jgi:transposase-like protein
VRVKGRWKYLYRAIDKDGATLDFYLADQRNSRRQSASFLPP